MNKSLSELKCEPAFPGLLLHCSTIVCKLLIIKLVNNRLNKIIIKINLIEGSPDKLDMQAMEMER